MREILYFAYMYMWVYCVLMQRLNLHIIFMSEVAESMMPYDRVLHLDVLHREICRALVVYRIEHYVTSLHMS